MKLKIVVFLTVCLYAYGFGWLFVGDRQNLMALTPFMLLFLAVSILWLQWSRPMGIFAATAAAIGFGAELLGVHTGWLFGSYAYGSGLGLKFAAAPLLIGVMWWLVAEWATAWTNILKLKGWKAVAAGALLVTLFDVLIEQVAIGYGWWQWEGGVIPLKNYLTWFIVAALLLAIRQRVVKEPPLRFVAWQGLLQVAFIAVAAVLL